MAKFIVSILISVLFSFLAEAQQKAEIKIVSSKIHLDSLFIEYEITNKSDKPFTYYRPKVSDGEFVLMDMWIVSPSGKKISKYRSISRGELDMLTVDKSHCTDILPGNTLSLNLVMDAKKFIGGASLQESGTNFALSIYDYQYLINCTDCNFKLLQELLSAEKEIEQQ
jgi:hypothetical protein